MEITFSMEGFAALMFILLFGCFALYLGRVLDNVLEEQKLKSFPSLQARENYLRRKREGKEK